MLKVSSRLKRESASKIWPVVMGVRGAFDPESFQARHDTPTAVWVPTSVTMTLKRTEKLLGREERRSNIGLTKHVFFEAQRNVPAGASIKRNLLLFHEHFFEPDPREARTTSCATDTQSHGSSEVELVFMHQG